ncbi:hypothetical protein DN546_36640, partial [Burkholderia multivorans]
IFLTIAIIIVFAVGFLLVHRVMTKPGSHIGSRLPKPDPDRDDPRRGGPTSERNDPADPGWDPTDPRRDRGDEGPDDHLGDGRGR